MILRIFVPGTPKNANARSQWAKYAAARDRKHYRTLTAELASTALTLGWTAPEFTMIQARRISPHRRRRDPTGLAEQLKGPLDGLVDARIIPDDDENHIALQLLRSRLGPEPGIELTLFEVPQPPR